MSEDDKSGIVFDGDKGYFIRKLLCKYTRAKQVKLNYLTEQLLLMLVTVI